MKQQRLNRRAARALGLLGLALLPTVGVQQLTASTASAAAVPEWDHVEGWVSGSGMYGDIYWSRYNYASGTIRVYNDLTDNTCTALSQRIKVNGVWSGWDWIGSVCTQRSYPFNVVVSRSATIEAVQFKAYEAGTSNVVYDTNSPGGA